MCEEAACRLDRQQLPPVPFGLWSHFEALHTDATLAHQWETAVNQLPCQHTGNPLAADAGWEPFNAVWLFMGVDQSIAGGSLVWLVLLPLMGGRVGASVTLAQDTQGRAPRTFYVL